MSIINITAARDNFYKLVNEVNQESTPVTIVNNRGENAVLISEKDWNSIQETLYLYSIPGYVENIKEMDKEDKSTWKEYNEEEFWNNL